MFKNILVPACGSAVAGTNNARERMNKPIVRRMKHLRNARQGYEKSVRYAKPVLPKRLAGHQQKTAQATAHGTRRQMLYPTST